MNDGDDQRIPRSWWADALNPVENLRALADVQRFGRQAAEDFADRMVAADTPANDEHDDEQRRAPDLDALLQRLRVDSVRAADLWADLIDGAATMVGSIVSRGARPGAAPSDRDRVIDVGSVSAGETAREIFWIHNSSASAVNDVRPHCAPLRSHLGHEMDVDVITFDPPGLMPLPPRSSCGIEVSVAVPQEAVPATYITVVLVTNVPALYLPLLVTVVSDETDR
jgi:hypothetical protein